jgi:hypothetical protein
MRSPDGISCWFWLKEIAGRDLRLAQPHRILVLVKGDRRTRSQVSPTTQIFDPCFDKFSEKSKNSKKHIENPKKYIFNIFASFLAFLASSQKNLNFEDIWNAFNF